MKTVGILLILFLGSYFITSAPSSSDEVRSGLELCAELTREVNLSVEAGLLTQGEADRISSRCFDLYGGSK